MYALRSTNIAGIKKIYDQIYRCLGDFFIFFIYRCISIKVAVNGEYSVLMSLWEQQLARTKYPHTIISHHRVDTIKT